MRSISNGVIVSLEIRRVDTVHLVSARDDHAGGPKEAVLQPVTAAHLPRRRLRALLARLVRDGFVQIRIELLTLGVDRLRGRCRPGNRSAVSGPCSSRHKIGEFSPSLFAAARPSSKLSTIGNQALEERAVGVLDRVLFFAGGAFFVSFEVGLAAQGEIAKTVEIGLQAGGRIVVASDALVVRRRTRASSARRFVGDGESCGR